MTAVSILDSPLPQVRIEVKTTARKNTEKEVQLLDLREEYEKICLRMSRALLGQHLIGYISKNLASKSELVDDQASAWATATHVSNNCPDEVLERRLKEHELQFHQVLCWGRAATQYPWLPIYASELYDLIFQKPYLKIQPLLADYVVETARKTPAPPPELGKGFLLLHKAREETQPG